LKQWPLLYFERKPAWAKMEQPSWYFDMKFFFFFQTQKKKKTFFSSWELVVS